jgi:putative transposase
MPRRPRSFEDGGIYHVFNRGNNRNKIFCCDKDFIIFLNLLGEALDKHSLKLFHYCLMTNHFHFLVRNEKKEALPSFMHWLQLGYVRYFKKKYDSTGHLFEERFRSPKIEEESYYLQCGRYIERNPVEAKMVENPWDYPYSSASYYTHGKNNELISPNLYYLDMGKSEEVRRDHYRRFVSQQDAYGFMVDEQLLKY